MNKQITILELAPTIKEILSEYNEEVGVGVKQQAFVVGTVGARAINTSASGLFNGHKYRRSWYAEVVNNSRVHSKVVVHSRQYRVAHLLEKSHKVGYRGAYYTGRAHIAPVEQTIAQEFEKGCKEIIQKH